MKGLVGITFELIFWVSGLILLAFSDPNAHHFTLCPLANLDIWCPGCGTGRAIALLFRGNIAESVSAHWFGIPALLLILFRIWKLSGYLINRLNDFKLKY